MLRTIFVIGSKNIREFVVHTQGFNEDGSHNSFCFGHYFPVTKALEVNDTEKMFALALNCFMNKVKEKCGDGCNIQFTEIE